MSSFLYALIAVVFISLISLVGIFALSLKEKTLDRIVFFLLALGAGAILGASFFDLLPESFELLQGQDFLGLGLENSAMVYIAFGFMGFFFLERVIYWYHGHGHEHDRKKIEEEKGGIKPFAYINLIGDGMHNFIDGVIIYAAFALNTGFGLIATVGVFFHELPQEIGDFGILIFGGLSKKKALILNFVSALVAVAGVVFAHFFIGAWESAEGILVAIAAGGFIYLGAGELLPEIQKELDTKKLLGALVLIGVGLFLILALGLLFPE
ncbi:MAG: ZIP family metal transporter [Thermoplasmata archaeon]|nr:ZIP family metal transporter [Thermoplasmata archaeon]